MKDATDCLLRKGCIQGKQEENCIADMMKKQDCIPVGCVPTACWPYPSMHCTVGGGGGGYV